MIKKLRYGNTNTFFISGTNAGLLIDTQKSHIHFADENKALNISPTFNLVLDFYLISFY